jgi:hypothetical protein
MNEHMTNGGSRFLGLTVAGVTAIAGIVGLLSLMLTLWTAPINEKITDLKVVVARIEQLATERGLILPQLRTDVNVNRDFNLNLQKEFIVFKERLENLERNLDRIRGPVQQFGGPRR